MGSIHEKYLGKLGLLSGISGIIILAGCVGGNSSTSTASANSTNCTAVKVITLANNPYLNHAAKLSVDSSDSEITDPNSVVTARPKVKGSDEEAYLGIPILNNTGSTIDGFYIHNWDRTAGNYINGYGMIWESGVEIAHTMQNNKYHDWYFPIGITEADVGSSATPWTAYGYLGGHTSSTDSSNPSTEWTIELSIGGKCYSTKTSRSEAHSGQNLVDTIQGWYGSSANAWAYGSTGSAGANDYAEIAVGVNEIEKTLLTSGNPNVTAGFWSEFAPDGNGGYNWNIHAGAGFAQQVNGTWTTVLKAVSSSVGNTSFDLSLDPSGCGSINSTLPSDHPIGQAQHPGGNWQYSAANCSAIAWDGTTFTVECNSNNLTYTSSLDMNICSDPTLATIGPNGVGLACGSDVRQGTVSPAYNLNINALIATIPPSHNPFIIPVGKNGSCVITSVTDNLAGLAASETATPAGITNITAQCYTQSVSDSEETGLMTAISSIDPQSCLTGSGTYDIANLNGSLVCGGDGSDSGVTVTGKTYGANFTYFGESVVNAAIPVANNSTLLANILTNMPNWINSELNAVNNVSFINYPQVCTGGQIEFDSNTQNLRCVQYQQDVGTIITDNSTLFNEYQNTNINSCSIIGAARDESGILVNIEYNCSYPNPSNVYTTTGYSTTVGFINPQLCYNNLMSESTTTGELYCNYPAPPATLPLGSWTNSCQSKNSSYSDGKLTATCSSASGSSVTSTLNYAHVCASGATVSDINGYLSCDSYGSWWNSSLSNQAPFSSNSWLSADNSSCIIQDIVPAGDYDDLANYACQSNDSTYRVSQGLLSCSSNLSNTDGVLGCSTPLQNINGVQRASFKV